MTTLRVAVIGAGHLGRIHARLMRDHGDVALAAVVDPDSNARREISRELQVATVDHHHELIGQIDAAIIATPTSNHHAVSRDLLRHGVHLFIEKPLTTSVADADDLLAIAERKQLIVQVGHVERFNPAFVAARPFLNDVIYVEGTRASGYACRSTDIGVVLDLMIHDLDIALATIDCPVVQIQATGAVVIGPHEDLAEARLTFANGAVANLRASRVSYAVQRRMRFAGRDGFATVDFDQKSAHLIRPSAKLIHGVHVDHLTRDQRDEFKNRLFQDYLPVTPLPIVDRNAIADEQREFIASVRTGRTPQVTGRVARDVLAVADQIVAEITKFRHAQMRHPTENRKAG